MYLWFHSPNIGTGLTLSHHSDPKLDQLIDDSRATQEEAKRLSIYQDIQKFIVDKALWCHSGPTTTTSDCIDASRTHDCIRTATWS